MNEYEIRYLKSFSEDLNDILLYYLSKFHNLDGANQLLDDLEEKIELLKFSSEIYQYYDFPETLKRKYRYFIVGNYIVFYNVNKKLKVVTLYRILYKKRNLNNID